MPDKNLPVSVFHKILREQYPRVSEAASVELRNHIEEKAKNILMAAKRYATHAKRKTIMDADIRLALRDIKI